MKMTKRIISIISAIGVMMLLLIIVIIFSLSSNNGLLNPSTGRPAAQSTKVFLPLINQDDLSPTEEVLSDVNIPSGWLLHSQPNLGFEFYYPPDWFLNNPDHVFNDGNGRVGISTYDMTTLSSNHGLPPNTEAKIHIGWLITDEGIYSSTDEINAADASSVARNQIVLNRHTILRESNLTLGRYSVDYIVIGINSSAYRAEVGTYYIPNKDRILKINVTPDGTVHRETIEKMISTIRFLR